MKTALYQINSKYVHSSLAVWYLSVAVLERGFECEVLEGSINESEDVLFSRAVKSGARIIALSVYIWNVDIVLSLAERLKAHDSTLTLILGGPEVSYRAEQVLCEYSFVDYVISGEGEVPFSRLVASLAEGTSLPDIDGICTRGDIRAPFVMDSDPPCPYTDEYLSRLGGRIAYIETSRGCPFCCAYCLSCTQGVRFFDLDRAKRDILTLARSGAATVKFVDRTFNADKKRAREIFSFIIDKYNEGMIPRGVTFHFEIAGELLDVETLCILRDVPAGLFQFEIGVQSMNEKTLRAIHRYTDTDKLSRVIKELSSWGNIHIHTDLIAGLPYEDIDSFRHSYNTLAALGSHKLQLGFLKLLYGSDMRESPEIYPCEYESEPPYTVRSTPWLSEDDLRELYMVEKVVDGVYYSGRFESTTEYLLSATGLDPYTLALKLSSSLYGVGTPALDTLFDRLYESASIMGGVASEVLRDRMLYDRISHNNSCVIPHSLRICDSRLKEISAKLKSLYPEKKGVRRCIGILYSENAVIFADYSNKHPVTEHYEVKKISLEELYEQDL